MESIFEDISYVVVCAALLAWLASLCRQPVMVAYLLSGILVGPWGIDLIEHVEIFDSISRIGITLLLFLAGIVLHPNRLIQLFRKTLLITLAHSIASWGLFFAIFHLYGFNTHESVYAALTLIFSSTILVIKLMPTTTLHQRHMGSVCIAILIAQDMLAIGLLVFMAGNVGDSWFNFGLLLPFKAACLLVAIILFEQFVLRKIMKQSSAYFEVLYILCLGWCLGVASVAEAIGLTYEVGAFVAGVAMARSPLSRFLTEQLKPIRDFFLMFFFFVLGARLNLDMIANLWLPTLLLAGVLLFYRPFIFRILFNVTGEEKEFSKRMGLRLGQASEFGLIVAVAAEGHQHISHEIAQLIQITIVLSMMISSYIVIFTCPTPLGTQAGLKQD